MDLEYFDFVTAWHLTDVANVPSILDKGILSRHKVAEIGIQFSKVGWDKIVETRPEDIQNFVLCFVTPYNPFVLRALQRKNWYNKESKGLALLEIDLKTITGDDPNRYFVSNGNFAKKNLIVVRSALGNFLEILNWHSMLDTEKRFDENSDFHLQAEIHVPERISQFAIRNIWVDSQHSANNLNGIPQRFPVRTAENFFASGTPLPSPARENFKQITPLPATQINHPVFGTGFLVGKLGSRCVAHFQEFGTQLINFGAYDWID